MMSCGHRLRKNVSTLIALAPSAPKAETERCALGAPKGIGQTTRATGTCFAPTTKPTSKPNGHARKGQVGKLPPRTERLAEHAKKYPLIKSFAELSYRKATVSLAQAAATRAAQKITPSKEAPT